MESKEIRIVRSFNKAINEGNINVLSSLMTEDHTFVTSTGHSVSGKKEMAAGWQDFMKMFPDYKNHFESILQDGNLVVAVGKACGTYNGNRGLVPENWIEMPAAWKAIIENDKIKSWQVYADWTEGAKIIERDNKTGGDKE